ncbi:MAG: DUF721 domain-containing protein [Pyrinomonadaceae bacterium]
MNAIFRTLPGVLDAIDASAEARTAFVFAAWRRVAGAQLNDRTRPVALDGRQLLVAVSDKAWQRNLESLAPQLLFKLNALLGTSLVDRIEFRISPERLEDSESRDATRKQSTEKPSEETITPDLETALSTIADEALRRTVAKAAANCLSRQPSDLAWLNSGEPEIS